MLAHLRTAVLAALPGIDAPKAAFFRISRAIAGRLNLQPVNGTLDQTKDLTAAEVCPGVPGVTSDPTPGETPIVAFVGADGTPYVIARAADGMPGHTPVEVRHDATTAIRLVSKAASVGAKVYVGAAPTVPVALAGPLGAYLTALEAWAVAVDATISAAGLAALVPAYAGAATARASAASANLSAVASTKLEAQ